MTCYIQRPEQYGISTKEAVTHAVTPYREALTKIVAHMKQYYRPLSPQDQRVLSLCQDALKEEDGG